MSPSPPHRDEMYMLGHAPFLNQPVRGLDSWQVIINRFALSFLCTELDRDEMYEVLLFYILLICDDFSDIWNSTTWDNNVFIADHSFRKMVISTSQLHYCMLLCRTESRYKRQFASNSLLFTAFKTV